MKKLILTTVAVFGLTLVVMAQSSPNFNKLKYVTTGPDGSVAMTITDNVNSDKLELEAAHNFYKYEIIDKATGNAVFSSKNKGAFCVIDKNEIGAGAYSLRIFTSNFIITSQLNVSPTLAMRKAMITEGTSVVVRS